MAAAPTIGTSHANACDLMVILLFCVFGAQGQRLVALVVPGAGPATSFYAMKARWHR
jgi:hypothetical protein